MRLAAVLLLVFAACASAVEAPARPLVIASDLDNLPFAGVTPAGLPVGRDVEMMELLAARLGRPLRWRRMPFAALLDAVAAGDVDAVCATIGITPERAARVAFTEPYFATELAVLVRADADGPESLAALAGRRVHAARGTTSARAVRTALPDAQLVLGDASSRPVERRLCDGEVDAAVMDGPAADRIAGQSAGRLVRLAQPLASERYAIVVRRSDTSLRAALDDALRALAADGELVRLDRVYGLGGR